MDTLFDTVDDFFGSTIPFSAGDRITTRDGYSYDVVSSGEELLHPLTGAKLVLFTAHGIFDVKAFGAKGDGSTDDTDAIQMAIDAAASHALPSPKTDGTGAPTVYFPPGSYKLSSRGTVPNPAFDDGTGTALDYAGHQASPPTPPMSPETGTATTQAYCVLGYVGKPCFAP